MATIEVDDELVEEVRRLGFHATRQEAVHEALEGYVQRRRVSAPVGINWPSSNSWVRSTMTPTTTTRRSGAGIATALPERSPPLMSMEPRNSAHPHPSNLIPHLTQHPLMVPFPFGAY